MERVATIAPMSRMQEMVCLLLGALNSYAAVAEHLSISEEVVRKHTKRAAAKIPGDLPAQAKAVAWARGAGLEVLTGTMLRVEIVEIAARRTRVPTVGPRQKHDRAIA